MPQGNPAGSGLFVRNCGKRGAFKVPHGDTLCREVCQQVRAVGYDNSKAIKLVKRCLEKTLEARKPYPLVCCCVNVGDMPSQPLTILLITGFAANVPMADEKSGWRERR